jgi:hypothetical protein
MLQIDIYDTNLNRVGVLQTWVSMVWREDYNNVGKFQIEVQLADDAVKLLKPWNYCGLRGRKTVMVIQSVQITDNRIVANGAAAVWLLDKRISTEVYRRVNAEAAMHEIVECMTPWPCVEPGELVGFEDVYPNQTSDGTVLEYCRTIGETVDMGFRLRKDGQRLLFECYKPTLNDNARYSDKYGNISDTTYTISDIGVANVALVAGAGEGDARMHVEVGAVDAVGAERFETYIDARNIQPGETETMEEYYERLVHHGEQKLVEMRRVEAVKFSVQDDRAQLGDLIRVNLSSVNLQVRVRVVSEEIVSQRNQIKRSIGVGTPMLI